MQSQSSRLPCRKRCKALKEGDVKGFAVVVRKSCSQNRKIFVKNRYVKPAMNMFNFGGALTGALHSLLAKSALLKDRTRAQWQLIKICLFCIHPSRSAP